MSLLFPAEPIGCICHGCTCPGCPECQPEGFETEGQDYKAPDFDPWAEVR
jgi:hypothetical protein